MLIVVGSVERQRRMVQGILAELGGRISPQQLDASVRRVLWAKEQAGLLGSDAPSLSPAAPVCSGL